MTHADGPGSGFAEVSGSENVDHGLAERESLEPSEATDEDELGADPLEVAMDPPEHWMGANRYGTTPAEQATERPLDSRLDEEQPDVAVAEVPARPLAATPLEDLDESIDDQVTGAEPVARQDWVVAPAETDESGETAVDTEGYLVTEPDQPAADETVTVYDGDRL